MKNVQDLRPSARFDELDASEGGSLLLSELAALVAFAFVGSFSPGPNNAVLWAAGGAALAGFVADERRRRVVNVLLAGLIVASVVLLWI